MFKFRSIIVCMLGHSITAKGLAICDGVAIENRQLSSALKLNRVTVVEHLTSSSTIA